MKKQVHLAAHFPGVNNTTVWSDPESGSQTDFASFVHFAQSAERGLFDFLFLAEGLRLREHRGRIHDLDVVGRPDTFTVLNAIAAVTTHLGLGGTINTTFNEPYELARQFASLDHLSGGRAAWNLVTSSDAFTGENFRRGGFLDPSERYERAGDILAAATELWLSDGGEVRHTSSQFSFRGRFTLPPTPQGHPVLIQSGDSEQGREFGAATADAIFSRHVTIEAGQEFYRNMKDRLPRYGRAERDLTILPAATFVIGDTPADAEERAEHVRRAQVSPPTAIAFLEQVWGRDLSAYDPDGPLPDVDPDPDGVSITRGRVRHEKDTAKLAREWRELAASKKGSAPDGGLTIRELIVETSARQSFVGTAKQVAEQIDDAVQADASDGFILIPHLVPGGLDRFADEVVPELQDRGAYRTSYSGPTLRDHLDLPRPTTSRVTTPQSA
ncbi:LLM class flavin-dependent oxidoreductase [Pseudonocardia endophytica]|uniref:Alkanesulfonate monooxygenase SsuD/methylene tetrahydromethanopterin reductase-like flavin-dependent oxidoreductase (Luciferase family) n=1 Tax=Pseudonocardia endophytica TaxID=401976 RepID=A0A4R1I4Z2_PSEEN|nr:LLM class flavin-dependent oxidoreductase [Pseudonocardia endophytica]TCK25092.1 alkanesulfonate monooxygenase SsuD/methylene tetrahydromethanopterin reductase-like flavin-dependent oxidoreductase (luciferase family) [Pseudonocardia endophytica]